MRPAIRASEGGVWEGVPGLGFWALCPVSLALTPIPTSRLFPKLLGIPIQSRLVQLITREPERDREALTLKPSPTGRY